MLNTTVLDFKEVKSLFNGVKVQRKAVVALEELIIRSSYEIVREAVNIMNHEGKTVLDIDAIKAAVKTFENSRKRRIGRPLFHNIWIININGTCMLSQAFSGLKFPDTLFSGLLTGISQMFEEVTGRQLNYIVLDDLVVHLHYKSPLIIAIICDTQDKDKITALAEFVATSFLKIYKDDLTEQVLNLDKFTEFTKILEKAANKAGMKLPTDVEKRGLLQDEDIEKAVETAALKKELLKATESIRRDTSLKMSLSDNGNEDDGKDVNIVFSKNLSAEELLTKQPKKKVEKKQPKKKTTVKKSPAKKTVKKGTKKKTSKSRKKK
ncbi:MAG: hypothetical protein ACTSP4_05845 [Candidatus Hodarchaeales archaeon]